MKMNVPRILCLGVAVLVCSAVAVYFLLVPGRSDGGGGRPASGGMKTDVSPATSVMRVRSAAAGVLPADGVQKGAATGGTDDFMADFRRLYRDLARQGKLPEFYDRLKEDYLLRPGDAEILYVLAVIASDPAVGASSEALKFWAELFARDASARIAFPFASQLLDAHDPAQAASVISSSAGKFPDQAVELLVDALALFAGASQPAWASRFSADLQARAEELSPQQCARCGDKLLALGLQDDADWFYAHGQTDRAPAGLSEKCELGRLEISVKRGQVGAAGIARLKEISVQSRSPGIKVGARRLLGILHEDVPGFGPRSNK